MSSGFVSADDEEALEVPLHKSSFSLSPSYIALRRSDATFFFPPSHPNVGALTSTNDGRSYRPRGLPNAYVMWKLVVRFETLEKHSTNVSVERKLLTQTLVRVIVRIGSLADTSVSYRLESTLHRNVYAVHDVAESTPSLM